MWVSEGFISGNHERFTLSQMCGIIKVLFEVIMKDLLCSIFVG